MEIRELMSAVVWQASKLRRLLQEWERTSEDYHEQLNSAVADREQLQTQLDQMSAENTRCFLPRFLVVSYHFRFTIYAVCGLVYKVATSLYVRCV